MYEERFVEDGVCIRIVVDDDELKRRRRPARSRLGSVFVFLR